MKKLKAFGVFLAISTVSLATLAYTNIIDLGSTKKLVNFGIDMAVSKIKRFSTKSQPSLARYVPEQTAIYLEANNLADFFESKSNGATTQSIVDAAFNLTLEEHKLLSQTHLALAFWPKGQNNDQNNPFNQFDSFNFVLILETPNETMTNKIAPALAESLVKFISFSSPKLNIKVEPLEGKNIVVIGQDEVVKLFLASRNSQKHLSESSDFGKLKRSNPDHSHFFFYLSATTLKNNNLLVGQDASFLKSINAFSINLSIDPKEKPRLSVLADTGALINEIFYGELPVSDFHLANVVPANTPFFITCKFSAKQFSNNDKNNFVPFSSQFTRSFGDSSLEEIDKFITSEAKQKLLEIITGDVAFFLSLSDQKQSPSFFPGVANAVVVEVKDTKAAKELIEKSLRGNFINKKDYKGNLVYYFNNNAFTFVEKAIVLGEKEAIEKTLDSVATKSMLNNEKVFLSVSKEFPSTGLGFSYLNFAPVLAQSSGETKVFVASLLGPLPAQCGFYGGLDGQEIYVEPSFGLQSGGGLNNLYFPLIGGLSYWWQFSKILTPKPSTIYSNSPSSANYSTISENNEARTVEFLRLLHSVQMTYQAGVGNGNFGSAQQLGEQDLIDASLKEALIYKLPKNGYIFTITTEPSSREKLARFQTTATPEIPGNGKAFFVDDTGVIRYTTEPRSAQGTDPAYIK